MPTAAPETAGHLRRSAGGCHCCGSRDLQFETQIVSGFLAARAWDGRPELTRLASCPACGLRFFDRGLSDAEAACYCRGYRNEDYPRARWRREIFYTRAQHAALLKRTESPLRIEAMREALANSNVPRHFASAMDHGSDRGHMLAAVEADRKAVSTLPPVRRCQASRRTPIAHACPAVGT